MKIVDKRTFMALPPGTLYLQGGKWHWGGLCKKLENVGDQDWRYVGLLEVDYPEPGHDIFERYEEMLKTGASYPTGGDEQRDGRFEDQDLFLILEPGDVWKLLNDLIGGGQ